MECNARRLLKGIAVDLFYDFDFDNALDLRDCAEFDSQWVRVYHALEELKLAVSYPAEQKKESDDIREQAFKIVLIRTFLVRILWYKAHFTDFMVR